MREAKSLTQCVVFRGASTVANLTFDRFISSAVELRQRADKPELRVQYKEYLRRLEILSKLPAKRELSDKELLELFLHSDNKQEC